MDLAFLSNPANTAICAVTILAVVSGFLFFLTKRRVSIGRDGITVTEKEEVQLADKIPSIDRRYQNAMRDTTSDNKDLLLALMSIPDKTHQLLVLFKILEVVRHKIYINHLTRRFSDTEKYEKWKRACIEEVLLKLRYIENYAGIDIDLEAVKKDLPVIFDKLRELLTPALEDMVNEKLGYYKRLPGSEKTKSLIEKNETYLRGMVLC